MESSNASAVPKHTRMCCPTADLRSRSQYKTTRQNDTPTARQDAHIAGSVWQLTVGLPRRSVRLRRSTASPERACGAVCGGAPCGARTGRGASGKQPTRLEAAGPLSDFLCGSD
jgi:hypothetical protein